MKIDLQTHETVLQEGRLGHDRAVTEPSSSESMIQQ